MAAGLLLAFAAFAAACLAAQPQPQLVSRDSGRHGSPSDVAYDASIDGSGRFIAFQSAALNGGRSGIYLRDLKRQRTLWLGEGNRPVLDRAADRIVFQNGNGQLIARDLRAGSLHLAGRGPEIEPADTGGSSGEASISADGRYVAFASSAWTLLEEPDRAREREVLSRGQIYVRDLKRQRTLLASRAAGPSGAIGDEESRRPAISADGRYVAFTSEATNLVPRGALGKPTAVYVRDLRNGSLRLVAPRGGNPSRASAADAAISADGRFVAFVFSRFGRPQEIAVRDMRRGTTVYPGRFSKHPIPIAVNPQPALSPDGRFLAVVGGVEHSGIRKLFLVDLRAHRVKIVPTVGAESHLEFSSHGRFLAYDTFVENVPGRESGEKPTTSGEVYRLANPFLR